MITYTITERLNIPSTIKGKTVLCKNLISAKRKATKMQFFEGTVLVISSQGVTISIKRDGKWIDE